MTEMSETVKNTGTAEAPPPETAEGKAAAEPFKIRNCDAEFRRGHCVLLLWGGGAVALGR